MIKREFKCNFKSFCLWMGVLIGMFLIVYIIYPFIMTDEAMKSIDEMVKTFPESIMKAFNMDVSSISTTYGWVKSEGLMYMLIVIGLYASNLGYNIVLKEEYDKTIEYLSFVPVRRNDILTSKIIVGVSYIVLMTVILCLFNFFALLVSSSFDVKEFLLLSVGPILVGIPLFFINMYIATFTLKPKKSIGIGLSLVLIFYIISIVSELSENVNFMKYFSIYTLADTRNIIDTSSLSIICIIISIGLSLLFMSGVYSRYKIREFV